MMEEPRGELLVIPPRTLDLPTPRPQFIYSQQAALGPGRDYHPLVSYQDIKARLSEFLPKNLDRKAQVETSKLAESLIKHVVTEDELKCLNDYEKRVLLSLIGFQTIGVNNIQLTEKMLTLTRVNKPQPQAKERATVLFERLNYRPPQLSQLVSNHPALPYLLKPELVPQEVFTLMQEEFEKRFLMQCFAAIPSNSHGLSNTELQTITKRDLDAVASQTFAQLLKEYFLTRGAVIPVKTLKEVDDIQGQWKNVSPLPKVLVPEPTRKIDLEEKGEIIARQKKLSEIKKSLPQFNEVLWQELTHDKQIPAFFTRWEGTPKLARKTLREKTIDLFYDGVKPRDRFSAWVMGMWDQLDHYDPAKFFRIGFLSHARRDFGILESDLPDLVLSHKRTVSMKEKILSAKKNLRPVEDTLSYLVIKQLLEKLDNKTLNPYVSEKLHQYQKAHYGKRVATQQLLNDIESNPRQFVVDFFLADPDFKAYEVGNRMAQLTKQASEKARLSQLKTPQDLEFTHRQELKRVAWRTFVEGKYPSQRPEVVSLAYQSLLQVSRMARFTDQEAAFERITKLTDKLSKYSYNLNRLFQKVFSVKEGERLFTPPLKREPHYPFHEPKIEPKKPRFYKYVDIKDLPRALQMPGVKAVEYRDGDVRVILDHEKLGTVGKLLATKEILEKQFTAKIAHRMGPIHEKLRPYTKVVESIGLNIIAAVAASRFTEFYAHLTETPYDRIQQFSSAAIGYYFRQIGWKKVEIPKLGWNVPIYPQLNLRNTSKMFLRGGALSLGVAGPVLMMKQLGLIPQNADIVTTLATPILGKAIGGNIFTSLGLNIGSEQIVNAIFNEKGRSDEFGDWLMFREYDKRQADQLYQADTNKRHRARWKQLADLVDDQTLTPRTLLSAASQSQTIQDYLMMTIALNPSRYNFRVRYDLSGKQHIIDNLGNLHLLEQADRQIYHLAQLLPDNEPLKTKILAACLGKTTETPDDLTHTSNRLGNFGNKTIEWLKKKYGLIPNDKENDNTNDLSDFVAHLQRRVVGTQALSTTGSLGTSMLFLGLHQHDIEKTGGNLWETLVGPTYHGAPPLTLPLMSVNPQEIQVYNDQLATPQDRFNELALRFSELNYIYSLWQSGNLEQTPGKAEILSYYQVTDTQLDKLRDILVQNRLTSNDLATVSELYSQEHFQKDDLFELLAVSLNGKHTALGPLIDALPSAPHALNQALGQSIEAHHATSLVFGLSDQEGSQILSRLGIPPESLNVQIDFLPLTDEQKKELLTVDSPLTIVGKSVIIRDKEYPLAAIFYDDASPQAMATFSLLARVISSSDSVWQKAFSDSQFPYPVFLAQASKVYADQGFPQTPDNQFVFPDTSFFKTIRDAVIEGSHGQLSSSQINDLLSKAIHGDPSSYNTLTTTIRESDQNIAVLNTFNSAVPEPHENLMYDMVSQAHTKEDIVRQVRLFYDQFGLEPAVQRFDKLGLNWEKISHNDYTPPHFDLAKILNGQSDLSQELVNLNNKRGVVFIQDGKVAGSFHQIFNIPVSDYPADLKEIDDMSEGPINQTPDDFLFNLFQRNARFLGGKMVPPLRGFLGNQDTASGASNQATQLLEMIDGAGGGYQPTIGEPLNVFHHPDLYSSAYLLKLMYFIHNDQIPPEFSGVLSPSGNRPLPETNVDLLTTIINKTASPALSAVLKTFHLETMSKSQLDMLCAKMESFIGGRILTKTQGANAVQIAHLNNVAMGMTQEGLELDGMAAASEYYFGVDLTHLTLAQKIILDGLIQGPSAYSPFRYHTLTQEDIARGYYEMVDGSRHSIDIKEVFDVRDLSAKANQQLVYIGYDENPAKNRAINGILPILVKKDFFDGKNITASQVAEEIRKTSFINHLPPEISENSIPPGSGHRALAEIIGNGVKPGQPGYIAPNYDIYYDARSGTYLVNLSPSHRADTSIPQPINVEQLATETTSSSFNTNLETYFDQIIKTNQGNGNTFLVNLPKDSPISQVRLPTLEIYNESTDRVEKHLGAAVKFVNAYGTVEGQFADSPLLQYGAIAPGSSMKPFVISWLLQHGVKMTDTFSSAPVKMGIDGKPLLNALENWDPKLNNAGYVNLQVAVIGSMNVPIHRAVIKAFQDFPGGPEAAFRDFQAYLEKFGIAYSVPVTNPQTGVTTFVEATDVSQVPQGSIGDGYIYELFNRFPTAVAKFANADMVDSEGKGVWFDQVHDKNTIDAIIQVRQAMMDDTIRNQKINGVGLWPLTVLEDSKGGTTFWKTGTNASIVNGVQGPVTLDVWTAYKQPGSDHYDVAFMLVKGQDVASTVKNPDGSTRVIYSNVNLDARLGTDQNGAAWASTIDAPVLYYLVNDLSRRSSGNLAQGVITTNMH